MPAVHVIWELSWCLWEGHYQKHVISHSVPVCHAYQTRPVIAEPLQHCEWASGISWSSCTGSCTANGSFKHFYTACNSFKNPEICWHISRWEQKVSNATIFKWGHSKSSCSASTELFSILKAWFRDCRSGYSSKTTGAIRLSSWSTITCKKEERLYGHGNSSLGGRELPSYCCGNRGHWAGEQVTPLVYILSGESKEGSRERDAMLCW